MFPPARLFLGFLSIRPPGTKLQRGGGRLPPTMTPTVDGVMAAYLLVEPTVAGKVVLDIGPRPDGGSERLRAAGAAAVIEVDPTGDLPVALDVADESVDVTVCVARLAAASGDLERNGWLAEMRRVVRVGG